MAYNAIGMQYTESTQWMRAFLLFTMRVGRAVGIICLMSSGATQTCSSASNQPRREPYWATNPSQETRGPSAENAKIPLREANTERKESNGMEFEDGHKAEWVPIAVIPSPSTVDFRPAVLEEEQPRQPLDPILSKIPALVHRTKHDLALCPRRPADDDGGDEDCPRKHGYSSL
ncbi:hypothetical protein BKA70DRAFT_1441560 [Coprinopsis sp. MPI-PUGE-AT-0042]|nr:hypothetical protein BKA70DRAFT_1441560 [Coprinopsis sp. MPI-PUGE-AT-0042]